MNLKGFDGFDPRYHKIIELLTLATGTSGATGATTTLTDILTELTLLNIKEPILYHNGSLPSSIKIGNGTYILAVNADGSVNATVGGSVSVSNLETGLAKDGVDITTPTAMPTGGIGIRGWISAIWTKLNGTLNVTGSLSQAIPTTMGLIQNTSIGLSAVQISNVSNVCKYVIIQSASTNTGKLWIGFDNTVTAEKGILLFPTDNIKLEIANTNMLWVYATVVSQSVSVTFFN